MNNDDEIKAAQDDLRERTTLPGEELPPYLRARMSDEAKKAEVEQKQLSFAELSAISRQVSGDKTLQKAEIATEEAKTAEDTVPPPPGPPAPPNPPAAPTTWKK